MIDENKLEVMRKYSIHCAFRFITEIRKENISKKQENELLDFMSDILKKCKILQRKKSADDQAHMKIIDEDGFEWILPKKIRNALQPIDNNTSAIKGKQND